MPIARVVSECSEKSGALVNQLRASGFDVEVVSTTDANAHAADLEISIEEHGSEEALRIAAEFAQAEGVQVFVGRGALEPEVPLLAVEQSASPQMEAAPLMDAAVAEVAQVAQSESSVTSSEAEAEAFAAVGAQHFFEPSSENLAAEPLGMDSGEPSSDWPIWHSLEETAPVAETPAPNVDGEVVYVHPVPPLHRRVFKNEVYFWRAATLLSTTALLVLLIVPFVHRLSPLHPAWLHGWDEAQHAVPFTTQDSAPSTDAGTTPDDSTVVPAVAPAAFGATTKLSDPTPQPAIVWRSVGDSDSAAGNRPLQEDGSGMAGGKGNTGAHEKNLSTDGAHSSHTSGTTDEIAADTTVRYNTRPTQPTIHMRVKDGVKYYSDLN